MSALHAPVLAAPALPGGSPLMLLIPAALLVGAVFLVLRVLNAHERGRHRRLAATTPEQAFLQAGLGQVRPGAASGIEAEAAAGSGGGAITVLPDQRRSRAGARSGQVELDTYDLAVAERLGEDHPMASPGRHRIDLADAAVSVEDDDVEALLVLTAEHGGQGAEETAQLQTQPQTQIAGTLLDDAPAGVALMPGPTSSPSPERVPEQITARASGPTPQQIANQRYHLDWDAQADAPGADAARTEAVLAGQEQDWWAQRGKRRRPESWWAEQNGPGQVLDTPPHGLPAGQLRQLPAQTAPAPEPTVQPAAGPLVGALAESSAEGHPVEAYFGAQDANPETASFGGGEYSSGDYAAHEHPLGDYSGGHDYASYPDHTDHTLQDHRADDAPAGQYETEDYALGGNAIGDYQGGDDYAANYTVADYQVAQYAVEADPLGQDLADLGAYAEEGTLPAASAPLPVSPSAPVPTPTPLSAPVDAAGSSAQPSPALSAIPRQAPVAESQLSVSQRNALARAQAKMSGASNRIQLAEMVTHEAAEILDTDTSSLVVRSLEGPRVLWQYPSGDIWGQQTLSALMSTGTAVRGVVQGDPLAHEAATAVLAVPVASAGDLAGLIIARRSGDRPFTAQEENILDRLARVAGAAMDTLTRRGVLGPQEENTDPVTGLAPNESLLSDLRVSLRTQQEHGMPVSVVVVGIDGLNRLRQEQGNQIADHTMRQVAETVCRGLRVGDVPYRKADGEIAVLLAATGYGGAQHVAARLQETVAEVLDDVTHGRLSAQVVVVPVSGTVEDVVRAADATLATTRMV